MKIDIFITLAFIGLITSVIFMLMGESLPQWLIPLWIVVAMFEHAAKRKVKKTAEEWLRTHQKGFVLTDKDITDFANYIKGEY